MSKCTYCNGHGYYWTWNGESNLTEAEEALWERLDSQPTLGLPLPIHMRWASDGSTVNVECSECGGTGKGLIRL